MGNLKFSPVAAMKSGWTYTKRNLVVMLGLFLGYMVIDYILSFFLGHSGGAMRFIFGLFYLLFSLFFNMGYYKMGLDVLDGEEPDFSAFKQVMPRIWNYVGVGIVLWLIMFPSLILFILSIMDSVATALTLPDVSDIVSGAYTFNSVLLVASGITGLIAVWILIRLSFASLIVLDTKADFVEALKKSWKITGGHVWGIIGFFILAIFVNLIGLLVLIVGIFVTAVITFFGYLVLYRMLMNEDDSVTGVEVIDEAGITESNIDDPML